MQLDSAHESGTIQSADVRALKKYMQQGMLYGFDEHALSAAIIRVESGTPDADDYDKLRRITQALDRIYDYKRSGEGVKKKILITYGLNPETATLPINKKGEIKSDDVAYDIARSLTQDWHAKCAYEAVQSGRPPLSSHAQERLDKVAQDLITRLSEGLSLRAAPTSVKDPFYSKLIQKRAVQEHLANLYINHVSKEALAQVATFGFSPDSTLALTGGIIWRALYIAYENTIQTGFGVGSNKSAEGFYIEPQKPSRVRKSDVWIQQIRRFGPKLAKILDDEYKATYPEQGAEGAETIPPRAQAALAAKERSREHKELYPDWHEKENARRLNAAQHNEI